MKIKLEDIQRFKLKKWLQSEEIRSKLLDAAKMGDIERLCKCIFAYTDLIEIVDRNTFWYDIVILYSTISSVNVPKTIPILLGKTDVSKKISWDYENHFWYYWVHTFAKGYGWSIEYVAEMDIDDAIALMQETETELQLEREWQWSLTEIAYPYNKTTEKSEFKPLIRPDWMGIQVIDEKEIEPKKVQIPKYLLPTGNVVSSYGNFDDS